MPDHWTARVWREFHARNLTPAYLQVLLTLHSYRGTGGVAWPSHATLADRARCSVSTVQRALQQAQRLDLVSWVERRRRSAWRWLRTSNLYRFLTPSAPVQPGNRPCFSRQSTTGQADRGGENQSKKESLADMMRAAAAAPDLLAQRQAVMAQRMLTGGAVRLAGAR